MQEDGLLLAAVASRGERAWAAIAREVLPGRSRHGCRNRYNLLHGITRQGIKPPKAHVDAPPPPVLDDDENAAARVLAELAAPPDESCAAQRAGDDEAAQESGLAMDDGALALLSGLVVQEMTARGAAETSTEEELAEPRGKRPCLPRS